MYVLVGALVLIIMIMFGSLVFKTRMIDYLQARGEKTFTECQESMLHEISDAINELKAGRTEETYNILVGLEEELTTDIINSKIDDNFEDLLEKSANESIKKN